MHPLRALLQCKLRYSEVCDISETSHQVVECTELDHERLSSTTTEI